MKSDNGFQGLILFQENMRLNGKRNSFQVLKSKFFNCSIGNEIYQVFNRCQYCNTFTIVTAHWKVHQILGSTS